MIIDICNYTACAFKFQSIECFDIYGMTETGGIGTTIFYVIGSILVLGAVVLLVTKKRMGASK